MSIFGNLFGSEKGISKLTDGVYNGLDKSFLTKEERLDAFKEFLKLYEPYKLAQRYLMLIVCVPFVFINSLAVIVDMVLHLMSSELSGLSKVIESYNDALGIPFLVIVSFYFAGGAVEGIINRAKKHK